MKNIDMTEIMEKYLSLVSRTSYRILCDRKDSEFVTVTLFVNLSKRTDSFIKDVSEQLILREVCRLCRRRLIRRRLLSLISIDPDIFVASSPSVPSYDEYIARQAWQVFCRASSGFTFRQRMAYTLCELEGIPEGVVTSMGGFRLVSVSDALAKARDAVKEQLDHYGRMGDYAAYVGFLRKVEDQLTDKSGLQRRILESMSGKD